MIGIKGFTSKIGKYGRIRLELIRSDRQELYTQLIFSAGLEEYLIEINNRAKERIWELTQQIAQKQRITEDLKVYNQMAWIGAMNVIRVQAEEIMLHEIIYE
jgi:phosphatidylserine/phosphatidylglycerophosphate/cardiolipin synthase-like enzyme